MARILGIDYGTERLGFAVSDPTGLLATPVRVVPVRGDRHAADTVVDVVAETESEAVVVGLPVNMDGTHGKMAKAATAFADRLSERLGIPVAVWDERLTTRMAERVLLDADLSRAKRKKVRDKLAARIMLQGYLDARNEPDLECDEPI
jgi:putative Holliday junction resolvase